MRPEQKCQSETGFGLGLLAVAEHAPSGRRGVFCKTKPQPHPARPRLGLEGIALQIHDLVTAMGNDLDHLLRNFKVDGGAAGNNLLMQLQADLIEAPVIRPQMLETTALGATMLAGLTVGFWTEPEELKKSWREERCFLPGMTDQNRGELLNRWRAAIQKPWPAAAKPPSIR